MVIFDTGILPALDLAKNLYVFEFYCNVCISSTFKYSNENAWK